MKPLSLILASAGLLLNPLAEARVAAKAQPSKEKTSKHAELALACYYGWGQPQDFHAARQQARLAGGNAGLVVEALGLGRGRGADQDLGRAWKLLAPLLWKGEPMAQAAAAVIMGDGLATDEAVPAVLAAEFREEIAVTPSYDPALRTERARLALTGLRPRLESDAVACVIAGQLYAWGIGIPRVGYFLVRMAAESGEKDAWATLALTYQDGLGVAKDLKAARKCLETGAELGSAAAAYNLGCLLTNGEDGPPDQKLAFRHFLAAAEQGTVPGAMGVVGWRLMLGNGVEKDEKAAVAWLRKAVAQGDAAAMDTLGVACERGAGGPADAGEALKLYRAAAESGNPPGMLHLAMFLQLGKAGPADPEGGFRWLRKAADLETKEAFIFLSRAYENGTGTGVDPAEAWKWLMKAAEAGDADGCYWLAEGFRTGRVTAPAPTLAFRWYTKAAELGHPTGTNNLGCCYQFGTGVSADPDRAFALYTRAAELGDPMALINLAICHEQGIGTPVNREKAGELRRRAAAAPR